MKERSMGLFSKLLIVVGDIFAIWGALLVFKSNLNAGLLLQFLAGVFLVILGLLISKLKKARFIIYILGAIFIIYLGFIALLASYGSVDNSTGDEDSVIVLGAALKGERPTVLLRRRLNAAIDYSKEHPNAKIIVTGGQGFQEDIPEGVAMKKYLVENGISAKKILVEDKAKSTYENYKYSKEIMDKNKLTKPVAITNDFHTFRSVKTGEKLGVNVTHISSETQWYLLPSSYMRESLAVLKMWILGPQ